MLLCSNCVLENMCSSVVHCVVITWLIFINVHYASAALNRTEFTTKPLLNTSVGLNVWSRSLISQKDDYVVRQRQQCSTTHKWAACIRYKASKLIWQLATNSFGLFSHEYSRELRDDQRRLRLIQLGEPSNMVVFPEARNNKGDNESASMVKFVKRALEVFAQNHGLQLNLANDSGLRVTTTDLGMKLPHLTLFTIICAVLFSLHICIELEARGHKEKKKIKWTIILQLITLIKIAHLKMTLVNLLLATLALNLLLVLGGAWIINYLKTKTLCKIHPEFVHHHSHAYDDDPHEYSQFLGSDTYGHGGGGIGGVGGAGFGSHGIATHDTSGFGYGKDWGGSQRKAYRGYNFLDTISKRLK